MTIREVPCGTALRREHTLSEKRWTVVLCRTKDVRDVQRRIIMGAKMR